MQINLSMEQVELLNEILSEKKQRLQMEISHTDRRDFRQTLQHNEFVLDCLLEAINLAKANVLQECP